MATFSSADQLTETKYPNAIKTALAKVKVDVLTKFIYFESIAVGAKKFVRLLVDYDAKLPEKLSKPAPAHTAKGDVTLTAMGELRFERGIKLLLQKAHCIALQKHLGTNYTVYLPTPEEDGTAAEQKPKVAATPAKAPAAVPAKAPATAPAKAPPKAQIGGRQGTGSPAKKPVAPQKTLTPLADEEAAALRKKAEEINAAAERVAALALIKLLEEQVWRSEVEHLKPTLIKKLNFQVSHGNYKAAITEARNVSAKVVKDGERKWDTLPGVDDYFLNPPLRNAACEKVSEEAIALISLIDEKTATNAKLAEKFAPMKAGLSRFYFTPKSFHVSAKALEKELDPARGVEDMTRLFKELQKFQKEKEDAATAIRELWLRDQGKRFQQEVAEGRGEKSKLLAKNLGEAQFLEMAQMAETLAKNKHGAKLNLFGPEFDPTILLAPMTLAEVASLYGYSTQDFTTLNGILRGTRANPADEAKASSADAGTKPVPAQPAKSKDGKLVRACDIPAPHIDYTPYVESCKSALTKLPAFKGEKVFRSDKDLPDFLIEEIIENGTMTQKSFVSCGLQKVPGFGEWVSEISGVQTGREITMFSLHSTEGEVLFPPGSVFRFKGCKIDGVPYGNHKDLRNILTTKTKKVDFEFTQQS